MNYLTVIENDFIEALKNDYTQRGDKSFFSLLFKGIDFSGTKKFNQEINSFMELDRLDENEFPANVQWLMNCMELMYIGKYQQHFVGSNSDAEVFSIGTEIQNIPYYTITSIVADMDDDFEQIVEYYAQYEQVDFRALLKEYEDFCQQFNLVCHLQGDYIMHQTQDFNPH
jgi:hypothetical protein